MAQVAIVMGSESDWSVMESASRVLDEAGVGYDIIVLSAHRTPERLREYVTALEEGGVQVVIAGAGWAAHLAGFIASYTPLPVIGVPISSSPLKGLDALFSTVQMPPGVPVATVAVDCAQNAACLAIRILALQDSSLTLFLRERL
jgi:phosphoribosylaminoimidazole carboxylase PurE protein